MELSGKLSSLNIGSNNESNNEEKDEVSSTDAINNVTLCANCGKEGGESMNTCNNCDLVNIVMWRVKRNIDQGTKRSVRNEQLNYMMRNCSKILRHRKSAQYA